MTQSELERLATIETLLADLREDIGEFKRTQKSTASEIKEMCSTLTTHQERIRYTNKSLAGVWAVVAAVTALLIGAFVSHILASNYQADPREVTQYESRINYIRSITPPIRADRGDGPAGPAERKLA